jgi:peroxiredoxin Q/BCP
MTEKQVSIGSLVPDFEADATGGRVALAAQRGKKVVLYFYPKDSTPGCTTETREFGDASPDFAATNAVVFGISRDSLKSHAKFKENLGIPFELISDPDEALCALFGVMKMKNMYGKQVRGIERSTFLIDSKGVLVKEWRGVKVPGHVADVLSATSAI